MRRTLQSVTLLMAEDDDDDFLLASDAFKKAQLLNPVKRVRDGEELMEYLQRRGNYAEPASSPEPGLILLDLNMPKKDGREAITEIKANANLRHYPIVVLTTSNTEEDILRSYDLGVASYIRKPVTFKSLVEAILVIGRYWFEIVELPIDGVLRR